MRILLPENELFDALHWYDLWCHDIKPIDSLYWLSAYIVSAEFESLRLPFVQIPINPDMTTWTGLS